MKNSRNNNYPLGEDFYSFQIEENKKNQKHFENQIFK